MRSSLSLAVSQINMGVRSRSHSHQTGVRLNQYFLINTEGAIALSPRPFSLYSPAGKDFSNEIAYLGRGQPP
ncbi:MAG: hypothetical protein ACP5D7_12625 [Limnospira sp.]